jgi:hypothetical protein
MTWGLYFDWIAKGTLPNYQPPIPLMVVLYNGKDKEYGYEISFQDLFPHLPDELKPFVPQFKIIFINLNWFQYDNLPGKPETKAIVESMKRATDGTFAENLERILGYLSLLPLDEHVRDIVAKIVTYCSWTSNITLEQIQNTIQKTFTGQEGINMSESFIKEAVLKGELQGELKTRVNDILVILRARFNEIPQSISDSLQQRTDAIALESLVVIAATCTSLDEFAKALK